MTTRTIHYNAIKGCFEMRDDKDWHRTHDDYITGVVLRDESPAPSGDDDLSKLLTYSAADVKKYDAKNAAWLEAEAQRIKRDRHEALINRGLAFALALVVIGLVLIVLGVLR